MEKPCGESLLWTSGSRCALRGCFVLVLMWHIYGRSPSMMALIASNCGRQTLPTSVLSCSCSTHGLSSNMLALIASNFVV